MVMKNLFYQEYTRNIVDLENQIKGLDREKEQLSRQIESLHSKLQANDFTSSDRLLEEARSGMMQAKQVDV